MRPILSLIPGKCPGTDTDTETLLNKELLHMTQKLVQVSRPIPILITRPKKCPNRDRYWYHSPWYRCFRYDIDTDTFAGSKSRLIPIAGRCPGTDTDTETLLNKNSAKTIQKMHKPLDRYRDWYRDSKTASIETDTDTKGLGIGLFDTIPIFPSVSAKLLLKCGKPRLFNRKIIFHGWLKN